MRLLEKAQIITLKSTEKKQELDEGLKLARKVDKLREIAAQEETNLAKFRDSSLKVIKQQIERLTYEKAKLETNISNLKVIKQELQKPLDGEWVKVKQERDKLTQLAIFLKDREYSLDKREESIIQEEREKFLAKQKALDNERLTFISLKKANENEEITEKVFRETEKKREEILSILAEKTQEIAEREAKIAIREREVNLVTENNEKVAKSLAIREKQVTDRYQTLERTLLRIKQNGNNRTNANN